MVIMVPYKERICSFSEGRQKNFGRTASPKSESSPFIADEILSSFFFFFFLEKNKAYNFMLLYLP